MGAEIAMTVHAQACLGRVLGNGFSPSDSPRKRLPGNRRRATVLCPGPYIACIRPWAIEASIECGIRKCARQPGAWFATEARFPEEYDAPAGFRPPGYACLYFFGLRPVCNSSGHRSST